jgi:hypothetical protein
VAQWLTRWQDHRAIGVVHAPSRERWGDDVPTVLDRRYDAFVHLDDTGALRPLHLEPEHSKKGRTKAERRQGGLRGAHAQRHTNGIARTPCRRACRTERPPLTCGCHRTAL